MIGAASTLHEFATLLEAVTRANSGVPPAAGSWDGGGANQLINAMYLGLIQSSFMKTLPFFSAAKKFQVDCGLFRKHVGV